MALSFFVYILGLRFRCSDLDPNKTVIFKILIFFQDPIPTVPVKGTPVKSGLHSYTLEDLAYARSGDKGTEQVKRKKLEKLGVA